MTGSLRYISQRYLQNEEGKPLDPFRTAAFTAILRNMAPRTYLADTVWYPRDGTLRREIIHAEARGVTVTPGARRIVVHFAHRYSMGFDAFNSKVKAFYRGRRVALHRLAWLVQSEGAAE